MFLPQLFGLWLLIMGIAMLARGKSLMGHLEEFMRQSAHLFFMAACFLALGLAMILKHNIWEGGAATVLVTIFGWLIFIKSLVLIFMPNARILAMMKSFNKPAGYMVGGIVYLILGIYLAGTGFAFF